MIELKDKKILLTGGKGFLGSYVYEILLKKGIPKENITITSSKSTDLRDGNACAKAIKGKEIVIHCAGKIGGIRYTLDHPGEVFYDNASMALNIIEESRKAGVEKLIFTGTACEYPRKTGIPYMEEELWSGYPDEINATYGLAKRFALVHGQSYRKEYNFNCIHLLLANLYGPRDDFSIRYSHVIAALIMKAVQAVENGKDKIEVWGTGKASREFLFVEDAAEAIVLAAEKYDKGDPINVGTGSEITIKELAGLIGELAGFKGYIVWDASKPDGQPRRCLDISKAKREFGFEAKTGLREGLAKTIEWYKTNRDNIEQWIK